jgi:hypothetical protein
VYWYSVNVKGLLSNSNGLTTGDLNKKTGEKRGDEFYL